jgi:thiol-disulfide isomerase/thioredoxin
MKTRALSLAAAATLVLLSGSAFAHPGEGEHAPHTMTVEPVRTAAAAQKILDRERAEMELPKLMVGADAPKLAISEWVKGDSVRGFESGRTYVVEFWATWCGPCIRAFPHLSEVQAKHKDDLTIIGVNIWDRKKNRQTGEYTETMPDLIERVNTFVDGQGEKMGYTVAIERPTRWRNGGCGPRAATGSPPRSSSTATARSRGPGTR